jgi:gluconolactonase
VFAPPPIIETEVFARLPDEFRSKNLTSEWVRIQRSDSPTDSFLEGPSFDKEGNLYVVDIPNGRVFRVSPGGEFTLVVEYDGEPNGLKIHKDGRIFLADHKHGLMSLDPGHGTIEPILDRPKLERFKGLNDLAFASNGDVYFTDQGQTGLHDPTGRLYRLRHDGQLDLLLNNIPSPNGLVITSNNTILYLAVTRGNCVWRVPLLPDGSVGRVGIFVQLSGSLGGPDGLALDEKSNLAIAHIGLGTVWLFNWLGEPVYRIRSCQGLLTTNLAYGGPERRTLYITEAESGTILRAELDESGQEMYSHMG